jgi:hypothetical protein
MDRIPVGRFNMFSGSSLSPAPLLSHRYRVLPHCRRPSSLLEFVSQINVVSTFSSAGSGSHLNSPADGRRVRAGQVELAGGCDYVRARLPSFHVGAKVPAHISVTECKIKRATSFFCGSPSQIEFVVASGCDHLTTSWEKADIPVIRLTAVPWCGRRVHAMMSSTGRNERKTVEISTLA